MIACRCDKYFHQKLRARGIVWLPVPTSNRRSTSNRYFWRPGEECAALRAIGMLCCDIRSICSKQVSIKPYLDH